MRIFLGILIILSSISCVNAYEYTHSDGSHIRISIADGINPIARNSIDQKIKDILPRESYIAGSIIVPNLTPSTHIEYGCNDGSSSDPKNWEYTIDVQVIYQDTTITSVQINTYEYTGGAHGSSSRIGLVIDNQTGNIYSLHDLFDTDTLIRKLGPIWQKQIKAKLENEFKQTLSPDELKWIQEGTQTLDQYSSFVITPRALIIYGQQYQHNAYAYGMQTLVFPRLKLKDISK